jgi:hypothetical protein
MITWLQLAPFLLVPGLVVFLAGLLPDVTVLGTPIGGGLVREWCVNHLVLPVLPVSDASLLVAWYLHTRLSGELLLHALVALNLNTALLLVLYPLFAGFIRLNHWMAKTDLTLKRTSAKR